MPDEAESSQSTLPERMRMMVITWIDRMRNLIQNHKFPFAIAFAVIASTMLVVHAGPAKDPTAPSELSGPVVHYTFDVREGDKVENAAGEAHQGKGLEASFIKVEGSGKALSLRQNEIKSGYVETANHEDLNPSIFTVAAWIKLGQTNKNGSIVCKHDWEEGGARGYVLRCYSGEQLNFTVGAKGWIAAVGKTKLPAHEWIHVAGAFDGTNITVYVNGRLDGTNKIEKPYEPSPFPLRIGHGAFKLDTHRKFDGEIDDVMIWKRVLSEEDLRAIYDDQKGSKPAPLAAEDIAGLIKQLGAANYKQRNAAEKALVAIGREVLPLLQTYRKKDDPEIIGRLKRVEQAIKSKAGK